MSGVGRPARAAIREERAGDEAAIGALVAAAFEGHPQSEGTEALIVARLRECGGMSLSLVAEENGLIVGHVAFSPVRIGLDGLGWHALAPLAVAPDRQGSGIGSALVREGLARLADAGAGGCVVLGEPGFYSRFGFAVNDGIVFDGPPREYFMALVLAGPVPEGATTFHDAFAVG